MSQQPTPLQQFLRLLRRTGPWWLLPVAALLVFVLVLILTDFVPLKFVSRTVRVLVLVMSWPFSSRVTVLFLMPMLTLKQQKNLLKE